MTGHCGAGDEQQIITIPVVLGFVGFTSVMMFVLFFVLNKWIFYVFVFLFAYGAAVASAVCMHTLVATFKPIWLRPTVPVKWASFKVRVSDVAIASIAIVATVVWLIFRCDYPCINPATLMLCCADDIHRSHG